LEKNTKLVNELSATVTNASIAEITTQNEKP
jgi:hypothetical protein